MNIDEDLKAAVLTIMAENKVITIHNTITHLITNQTGTNQPHLTPPKPSATKRQRKGGEAEAEEEVDRSEEKKSLPRV